ncbi:MAG: hypothetical protein WBN83_15265 [Desulfoprunum sp.]|jgi:hypothetical protein|uniref:hypothetical protein n=1 Tax=Desulfoprunum sp. TaxID=2020866 RepID=UPI00052E007F|nr:hypothetical protein JT06_01105 [Desulfobulbus sp. Tol-SR]
MTNDKAAIKSQLLPALREGLSVIQMIVFKEIRAQLARKRPESDPAHLSRLAGTITNELFGTPNPEEQFVRFRQEHWGTIEQELLGISTENPGLRAPITDALRVQALCDSQEGLGDDASVLARADALGILVRDRDIPLPSTFMTMVRELGRQHNLIIPPMPMDAAPGPGMVH